MDSSSQQSLSNGSSGVRPCVCESGRFCYYMRYQPDDLGGSTPWLSDLMKPKFRCDSIDSLATQGQSWKNKPMTPQFVVGMPQTFKDRYSYPTPTIHHPGFWFENSRLMMAHAHSLWIHCKERLSALQLRMQVSTIFQVDNWNTSTVAWPPGGHNRKCKKVLELLT
jgi:hypothetical protein